MKSENRLLDSPETGTLSKKAIGTENPISESASSNNRRFMPRLLGFVIGGLILISLVGLSVIYWVIQPSKDMLPYEIAKALIQLSVVASAGAIISIVVFEYQRERQIADKSQEDERLEAQKEQERLREDHEAERLRVQRRLEYRDDLLKSIMMRTIESYNSVKKTRRLLEARGKFIYNPVTFGESGAPKSHERIHGAEYDKYIDIIIDAQLQFETLKRDVETPGKTMMQQPLADHFKKMEAYLNEVIKEYRGKRRDFRSGDDSLELSSLPELKKFLPVSLGGSFSRLSGPMHDIQRIIREELLNPDLVEPANPKRSRVKP